MSQATLTLPDTNKTLAASLPGSTRALSVPASAHVFDREFAAPSAAGSGWWRVVQVAVLLLILIVVDPGFATIWSPWIGCVLGGALLVTGCSFLIGGTRRLICRPSRRRERLAAVSELVVFPHGFPVAISTRSRRFSRLRGGCDRAPGLLARAIFLVSIATLIAVLLLGRDVPSGGAGLPVPFQLVAVAVVLALLLLAFDSWQSIEMSGTGDFSGQALAAGETSPGTAEGRLGARGSALWSSTRTLTIINVSRRSSRM